MPTFQGRLTPQTSTSYILTGAMPADLAAALESHGLRRQSTMRPIEAARFTHPRGGIVVIYRTGTVLVQGPPSALPVLHALLCDLAGGEG